MNLCYNDSGDCMLENAKELLNYITSKGYKAYIVGGFVRNYLLGMESNDIDITTNATPKQLQDIFENVNLPTTNYGAVIINRNGIRYEITTFRKEISYENNRRPIEIKYIDDLGEDLLRRDFTVNTICIDKNGKIIDLLNARSDLDNKIIKTVGDALYKLEEDALRIIRAIRFSAVLGFNLDEELINAINIKKHLLRNISMEKKKEELDKIFSSPNAKKGIDLLLKFGLDEELSLNNLSSVSNVDSLMSVWSVLNVIDIYPFTNSEKKIISDVNLALKEDNYDAKTLYKYGLYVNQIAGSIKGFDKKVITELYNNLIIKSRQDLDITSEDIINIIGKPPGEYITNIYEELEMKVLYFKVNNTKESIIKYIMDNIDRY